MFFIGGQPEWGVTVLQADAEMDAGDIWSSANFSVPTSTTLTKSAFYNKVIASGTSEVHGQAVAVDGSAIKAIT